MTTSYVIAASTDLGAIWPDLKLALDGGCRRVELEAGQYTMSRATKQGGWYLRDYDGLTIDARGARIEQTCDDAIDFATIYAEKCLDLRAFDLVLDGMGRGTNEQTHGLLLRECSDFRLIRPRLYRQHGDGVKLMSYYKTTGGRIDDMVVRDTGRSGLSVHSGYSGLVIDGFTASGVSDQSIDYEHNLTVDHTIRNARITVTGPSRVALTVTRSRGLTVDGMVIEGGTIHGVDMENLTLRGVRQIGGDDAASSQIGLNLYRSIDGVALDGCSFEQSYGPLGERQPAARFEHAYTVTGAVCRRLHASNTTFIGGYGFQISQGARDVVLRDCRAIWAPGRLRGEYGFLVSGKAANPVLTARVLDCEAQDFRVGCRLSTVSDHCVDRLRTPACDSTIEIV